MAKKKSAKKPVKKAPAKKSASKSKVKAKVKAKAKPAKKAAPKKAAKKSTPVKKVTAKKAVPAKAKAKPAMTKALAAKPQAKVDYTKAITPLGDRLVIRLVRTERISPGGLILPDSVSSTEGYLKGEVLAAGHGTYTKKGHHKLLDVKIGDTVLFSEYSSTKVKFNNEDLHIVHENEVLGVTK